MPKRSVIDAATGPVRVGGQALPDGVVMRTAKAWAVARADGSVESGAVPPARLRRVPVLRVLAGLIVGLQVGFGFGGGRGKRRKVATWPFLRGLLATEVAVVILDAGAGRLHLPRSAAPFMAALLCLVALVIFRVAAPGSQWRYHGAEHKAVAAHEAGADVGDARAVMPFSRVHPRCGTNLVLWAAMAAPMAQRLPVAGQLIAYPLILGVIAELLSLAARHPQWLLSWVLIAPGRLLQAGVTTSEPSLEEQEIGCRALVACLERHEAIETGRERGHLTDRAVEVTLAGRA